MYIFLECADGSYYTGWTNSLNKRIKTHSAGKGAKYTRSRLPVKLIYREKYPTPTDARSERLRSRNLLAKKKSC